MPQDVREPVKRRRIAILAIRFDHLLGDPPEFLPQKRQHADSPCPLLASSTRSLAFIQGCVALSLEVRIFGPLRAVQVFLSRIATPLGVGVFGSLPTVDVQRNQKPDDSPNVGGDEGPIELHVAGHRNRQDDSDSDRNNNCKPRPASLGPANGTFRARLHGLQTSRPR